MPNIVQTRLMTSFVAGRRQHQGVWHVYVKMEPGNGYGIPWRKADELAEKLRAALDANRGDIVADAVRFDMPDFTYMLPDLASDPSGPYCGASLARVFYSALVAKARECEEQEKAPQIAYDAAILHRAGFPVGLSNDPTIKEEALKESQHNRELRRALPIVGVRSGEVLGTPTIESKPPVPEEKLS